MRLTLDLFGHRLDITLDRTCETCDADEDDTDDEDHPQGDVFTNLDRADPQATPIGFGPGPREDT